MDEEELVMNYKSTVNYIPLISDKGIGEYLPYEYQEQLDPLLWPVVLFSPGSYLDSELADDDIRPFMLMGGRDALKEIGPISKEDYDYYESL